MPGNMYENTKSVNPLGGRCEIDCLYCSTNSLRKRYKACAEKYNGPYRIYPEELKKFKKSWGQVFVCGQNDLFAPGVSTEDIITILRAIKNGNQDNLYMFQSKNPVRLVRFVREHPGRFPKNYMIGTTIETNLPIKVSNTIPQLERLEFMKWWTPCPKYITVEPIMKFTPPFYIELLMTDAKIIYIGADSKGYALPEPTKEETLDLITKLRERGIDVRIKSNLKRIIGG